MKLSEYRKKEKISHYEFGRRLNLTGINPATNVQRWCLESKEKRFPKPNMVKKILELALIKFITSVQL